ncbi:MAG TPA: hypothetical protein PKC20_17065, partial [Burkholderiaceae bacterium]|nr:hypothetical protein [Burkholderiaceae bacterium]
QRGYLNPPPSRSLQASHANHPGLHVLDATLGLLERIGWDRIHAQVDALGAALHAAASQAGFEPATPSGARAGIVSLPCAEPEAALARLHALGFRIEQRGALLRAAPHFYNSIDEVGSFVDALRRVARPLTGRS